MPPDLAVSAPLLSHTPTPVGSLVKGGVKGRCDDDDDKGGRQPLITIATRTKNRDSHSSGMIIWEGNSQPAFLAVMGRAESSLNGLCDKPG